MVLSPEFLLNARKAEQARGKKQDCRGYGNRAAVSGNEPDGSRVDNPVENDLKPEGTGGVGRRRR